MVSVIIPAFNEENGLPRTIAALKKCKNLSEIIVVDDGSQDKTTASALALGVTVITLSRNKGKGNAMHAGVERARNEIILFCDADMYGFEENSVNLLINPVLSGVCDMAVGLRSVISHMCFLFPFLSQFSGLRALTKTKWREVPKNLIPGYQVELILNYVARRHKWKVIYATIPGLAHTIKELKYGLFFGFLARIKMLWDLFYLFPQLYVFSRGRRAYGFSKKGVRFTRRNFFS